MTLNRLPLRTLFVAALAAGWLYSPAGLYGQSAEDLRLTIGKSVVIDYPSDIRQISTSNPDIVDASPVTTREILLHGKGLGSATLVVWSKAGQRTFYNVNVELNLDPLRRMMHETFPSESIEPRSSRDSISLNGTVSSKDVADRASVLATSFSKTVVNNLQLGTSPIDKQILLRVKFAELDRTRSSQFGVNLVGLLGQTNAGTSTGQFTGPALNAIQGLGSSPISNQTSITSALNIFALNTNLNLGAFIKALQTENVLEILAEPNLVTSNGRDANFLVGGEFPVPVLQGGANAGAVTIQFREFGIRLWFTPNMTPNKTIKMYLKQEVSTLDYANAVTLSGFTIPAISTRRAETNVELGEGQTFIVAGLLDNRETNLFNKLPVIASLPIIGNLFKSRSDDKKNTELILMVTPEITEPLGPNDLKPEIAFPNQFLKRLDAKDIQPPAPKKGGAGRSKK